MAKLYGVGVGPGDKELLTLKAVKTIEMCDVIVAPSAMKGGTSIALGIAEDFITEDKEVMIKQFPMGGEDQEEKIFEAFKAIEEKLKEGKNIAFLTLGDPFVYSTYIYLLKYIEEHGFEVETVPGITSFCASASLAQKPLVIGDEPLLIMPACRVADIKDEKYVVIMKIYKREEEVLDVLDAKGFKYVYIKRAGREGQEILNKREDILDNKEYMSLIIANRE
ncbi:MAG: cobalt-factor II C(20)-methyltransferase [Clostridium sp.]|uniref:cobalt-factor II C(20)-methyltransferase n=1 Tax=Clostridium sp. TaxID=1506 RepID=UPI00305D8C4D